MVTSHQIPPAEEPSAVERLVGILKKGLDMVGLGALILDEAKRFTTPSGREEAMKSVKEKAARRSE